MVTGRLRKHTKLVQPESRLEPSPPWPSDTQRCPELNIDTSKCLLYSMTRSSLSFGARTSSCMEQYRRRRIQASRAPGRTNATTHSSAPSVDVIRSYSIKLHIQTLLKVCRTLHTPWPSRYVGRSFPYPAVICLLSVRSSRYCTQLRTIKHALQAPL